VRRKLGAQCRRFGVAQALGRLQHAGLDLQHMRERRIALQRCRPREARFVDEGLGAGQRHRARTAQRTEPRGADRDPFGGEAAALAQPGIEGARDPAFVEVLARGRCGVPDLDRAEVRQVGLRVAEAEQQRQFVLLPQRHQRRERRVQPEAGVEPQQVGGRQRERRPQRRIGRVGIRHDGVQAVVAALQLDQHQHAVGR
jgi:hypothetical protein